MLIGGNGARRRLHGGAVIVADHGEAGGGTQGLCEAEANMEKEKKGAG
jgi:hypothetical protein